MNFVEKLKMHFEHLLMRFNYLDPANDCVQPINYRYIPTIYNASHARRMEDARAYLRKRGKYFIEQRSGWVPTKAANTDVKKTWNQYLIAHGRSMLRVAK
jgi:hypothetical protein